MDGGPNHLQTHVEQCVKHGRREIYVFGYQIFYLSAPLDHFKYMKMPIALFPQWTIDQYNLTKHALHGFVYLEMRQAVWGLPQAGILANKLLRKRLLPHG